MWSFGKEEGLMLMLFGIVARGWVAVECELTNCRRGILFCDSIEIV
jgi:hypothetical protein